LHTAFIAVYFLSMLHKRTLRTQFSSTPHTCACCILSVFYASLHYCPGAPEALPSEQPKAEPAPQPQAEPKQEAPNEVYLETKFQLMLEMSNKKLQEELHSVKAALNELNSEISILRLQIQKVQSKPKQAPKPASTSEAPVPQQTLPKEKKESHPRQGDFTSDDVSMEKMFHFGNK